MLTPDEELIALAHEWDRAMVGNDAKEIGRYMADDWIIVGSDGRSSNKADFLALIGSGDLAHDVMSSDQINVRVYGDVAVLISRGVSGGRFRDQSFREYELSSNVFVKQGSSWRCVLTHLSRLAPEQP